jgi:hypothetical protein
MDWLRESGVTAWAIEDPHRREVLWLSATLYEAAAFFVTVVGFYTQARKVY